MNTIICSVSAITLLSIFVYFIYKNSKEDFKKIKKPNRKEYDTEIYYYDNFVLVKC